MRMTSLLYLYASTASCVIILRVSNAKLHEMRQVKTSRKHKLRETVSFHLNANEEESDWIYSKWKLISDLYHGQIFPSEDGRMKA